MEDGEGSGVILFDPEGGVRFPLARVVADREKKWFGETMVLARKGQHKDKQILLGQMYNCGYGVDQDPDMGLIWSVLGVTQTGEFEAAMPGGKRPGYGASESDSDDEALENTEEKGEGSEHPAGYRARESDDGEEDDDDDKDDEARRGEGSKDASSRFRLAEVVSVCEKIWFQDALKEAQAGSTKSQVLVGQMYANGYGVAQDPDEGNAWNTNNTSIGDDPVYWTTSNSDFNEEDDRDQMLLALLRD